MMNAVVSCADEYRVQELNRVLKLHHVQVLKYTFIVVHSFPGALAQLSKASLVTAIVQLTILQALQVHPPTPILTNNGCLCNSNRQSTLLNKIGIATDMTVHLTNEGSLQTHSQACCRQDTCQVHTSACKWLF